jgi:vacuolar-type H+-ATPase subunit H
LFVRQFSFTIAVSEKKIHGEAKNSMNENRIQQVIEIEKQAQEIHAKAVKDAQQLPVVAEQEAQAVIEKARAQAQEEARQMISTAQAQDEIARIVSEAEEKNKQIEAVAMTNFDRAVNYVLDRVVGGG